MGGQLRDAAQRWQDTGTIEDEAAYLWAAVNEGALGIRRLIFAARLYYPAALLVLDGDPQDRPESFAAWADDLTRDAGRILWRLLFSDVQLKLRRLKASLQTTRLSASQRARAEAGLRLLAGDLECVRAYMLDPHDADREVQVQFMADFFGLFFDDAVVAGLALTPAFLDAESAIRSLAHVVAYGGTPPRPLSADPELLAALQFDVAPWILCYGDPLQDPAPRDSAETLRALKARWTPSPAPSRAPARSAA